MKADSTNLEQSFAELDRMVIEVQARKKREKAEREAAWKRNMEQFNRDHFPPHWFNKNGTLKTFDEIDTIIKEDMKSGLLKAGTGYN